MGAILEVLDDVEFRYPEDPRCCYVIPAGLTLSVGEAWCISGVSGSGKSTLMTLLAALRRLGRGRLRYHLADGSVEVTPGNWSTAVGPALWRRIGFAFQRPELVRALSVADNLRLSLGDGELVRPALFSEPEWRRVAGSRAWEISGGQVQRLGLLRAFGRGQRLIFLDEPTNNLDRRNRQTVAAFVQSHRATHALVVVSHDDDFIRTLGIDRRFEVGEEAASRGEVRRSLRSSAGGSPAPASGDAATALVAGAP
jgi:putative ABC transport system ATP-binding protein